MAQWWDQLTAQPDPNNPMSTYQVENPGLAEIIFKLASALGPAAPFLGGNRTTAGRVLGASAAVGGGLAGTMADLLRNQRIDPLAKQAQVINAALDARKGVTIPVLPEQAGVPVEGPVDSQGAFSSWGGPRPTGTIPAVTREPRTLAEFNANATPGQALAVQMGLRAGMKDDSFFPDLKFVSGHSPIVDVTDPNNPKEIFTPVNTPEVEASNLPNKIAIALAKNKDDPKALAMLGTLKDLRTNPTSPESDLYQKLLRNNGGNVEAAIEGVTKFRVDTAARVRAATENAQLAAQNSPQAFSGAANVAAGRETGQLNVMASPKYQQVQADIVAAKETAQRQNARMSEGQERRYTQYAGIAQNIDTIAATYKPEYVGGVPAAIGFQREMDKYVGDALKQANEGKYIAGSLGGRLSAYFGTIPADQARFYRSLADNHDRVLRARSGAQINEQEAKRLLSTVPNATDMPAVFEPKFNDFALDIANEQKSMLEAITRSPAELRDRNQGAPPRVGRGATPAAPRRAAPTGPPVAPGGKTKEERLKALGF
jgi:hypothetical protein